MVSESVYVRVNENEYSSYKKVIKESHVLTSLQSEITNEATTADTIMNWLLKKTNSESLDALLAKFVILKNNGSIDIVSLPKDEKTGLYTNNKSYKILFKLFPLEVPKAVKDRAVIKGIKDVAPDFDKILDRAKDSKVNKKTFKLLDRRPGIALKEDGTPYTIGAGNQKGFDKLFYLPNTLSAYSYVMEEYLPVYICFDSINTKDLQRNDFLNILRILVGKPLLQNTSEEIKISNEVLKQIWSVGISVVYLSLQTYGKQIDHIIIPSSTGKLMSYIREEFIKKFYPDKKVITISKPCIKELYKFYEENKSSYDKEFKEVVAPSYERTGKDKKLKISSVFKNVDGEFYDFLQSTDSYEEKSCQVIKLAKVSGYYHRILLSRIMSDYVIDKYKEIKDITHENILLLDDDAITGSTLSNFLAPIIKKSKVENKIYAFTLFGNGKNDNEQSLGIDFNHQRNK